MCGMQPKLLCVTISILQKYIQEFELIHFLDLHIAEIFCLPLSKWQHITLHRKSRR